jgi:hypothetical protein
MLFNFIILNLIKFLTENALKLLNKESTIIIVEAINAWKYSNFMYKNYILNGLDNILYDVYNFIDSVKSL